MGWDFKICFLPFSLVSVSFLLSCFTWFHLIIVSFPGNTWCNVEKTQCPKREGSRGGESWGKAYFKQMGTVIFFIHINMVYLSGIQCEAIDAIVIHSTVLFDPMTDIWWRPHACLYIYICACTSSKCHLINSSF